MFYSSLLRTVMLLVAIAASSLPAKNALAQEDWQKDWADTIARAKGQTLALIVQANDGHTAVVRDFQKRYPDIKVQLTIQSPSAVAPRIVTEQRNGVFAWDSWWSVTANMNDVVLPADGFDPITDYFVLPEVKDQSNWRAPQYRFTSTRGPFIFIHTYSVDANIYWNKDVVRGVDASTIDQLLNPKLKGLIAVRQPSEPTSGTFALAGLAKVKGPEFVEKIFAEQDPIVIDNPRQLIDTLMRGDNAIVIGGQEDIVTRCKLAEGCTNIVKLTYGQYLLSRGVSVFKNAPHKDATKVWINWLLSKDGQETYVREWAKSNATGATSMRVDVEPDPTQKDAAPDYSHLDDYLIGGADSGHPYMDSVIKAYNKFKDKNR